MTRHSGYGHDYILENLNPLRKERDQALSNYTYCQGYTDAEIQDFAGQPAAGQSQSWTRPHDL